MSEVTQILADIEHGDPHAAEQLLPLVYDELRKLAADRMAEEKPGQTLQATALVHEAYVRLVDADKVPCKWSKRSGRLRNLFTKRTWAPTIPGTLLYSAPSTDENATRGWQVFIAA